MVSQGRKREGSFVAASIVARWVGVDARTMNKWVEEGVIKGARLGKCYYVNRKVAERLRAGERPEE